MKTARLFERATEQSLKSFIFDLNISDKEKIDFLVSVNKELRNNRGEGNKNIDHLFKFLPYEAFSSLLDTKDRLQILLAKKENDDGWHGIDLKKIGSLLQDISQDGGVKDLTSLECAQITVSIQRVFSSSEGFTSSPEDLTPILEKIKEARGFESGIEEMLYEDLLTLGKNTDSKKGDLILGTVGVLALGEAGTKVVTRVFDGLKNIPNNGFSRNFKEQGEKEDLLSTFCGEIVRSKGEGFLPELVEALNEVGLRPSSEDFWAQNLLDAISMNLRNNDSCYQISDKLCRNPIFSLLKKLKDIATFSEDGSQGLGAEDIELIKRLAIIDERYEGFETLYESSVKDVLLFLNEIEAFDKDKPYDESLHGNVSFIAKFWAVGNIFRQARQEADLDDFSIKKELPSTKILAAFDAVAAHKIDRAKTLIAAGHLSKEVFDKMSNSVTEFSTDLEKRKIFDCAGPAITTRRKVRTI